MLYFFFQFALYAWLSVFWFQSHKEERFLFPIYPLICAAAALGKFHFQMSVITIFGQVFFEDKFNSKICYF